MKQFVLSQPEIRRLPQHVFFNSISFRFFNKCGLFVVEMETPVNKRFDITVHLVFNQSKSFIQIEYIAETFAKF